MNTKAVSVILLAGGRGTRMGTSTPKQFLSIHGRPLAKYSFDLFATIPSVAEIIVVCPPPFRHIFETQTSVNVKFAEPGRRRQDSCYNGLQQVSDQSSLVCVHDAARPCATHSRIQNVIDAARRHGAATLGFPVKNTIKEADGNQFVSRTPDRSRLWSIHTPQVIKTELLHQGFEHARQEGLKVTDDVSLVENLGLPVKLVIDQPSNIKLTTPEDFAVVQDNLAPIEAFASGLT